MRSCKCHYYSSSDSAELLYDERMRELLLYCNFLKSISITLKGTSNIIVLATFAYSGNLIWKRHYVFAFGCPATWPVPLPCGVHQRYATTPSIRAETVLRGIVPGQLMLPLYCGQHNSIRAPQGFVQGKLPCNRKPGSYPHPHEMSDYLSLRFVKEAHLLLSAGDPKP